MNETTKICGTASRRSILRRGAKLAYVAPAVVVALKAESVMASVSPGDGYNGDYDSHPNQGGNGHEKGKGKGHQKPH